MKILIDTNILISAALNSNSVPAKAFYKAITCPNKGVICEQNIDVAWTCKELEKMSKNETVSMDVLMKVCMALDCNIGDIVDLVPIKEKDS